MSGTAAVCPDDLRVSAALGRDSGTPVGADNREQLFPIWSSGTHRWPLFLLKRGKSKVPASSRGPDWETLVERISRTDQSSL